MRQQRFIWIFGPLGTGFIIAATVLLAVPNTNAIDDPWSHVPVHPPHWIWQAPPVEVEFNILLQPHTVGEDEYWSTFDWDSALRIGAEAAGLPYCYRGGRKSFHTMVSRFCNKDKVYESESSDCSNNAR